MERRAVIIIGDSVFATALSQMLGSSDQVSVVGCVPTLEAAAQAMQTLRPDAMIVAETERAGAGDYGQLLSAEPDLSIIRANLNADSVQIITSHRIGTRPADLLTAIAELPKRR